MYTKGITCKILFFLWTIRYNESKPIEFIVQDNPPQNKPNSMISLPKNKPKSTNIYIIIIHAFPKREFYKNMMN